MERTTRVGVVLLLCGIVGFGLVEAPPASAAVAYPPVPASIAAHLPTCLNPMTTATLPQGEMTSAIAAITAMAGSELRGIGPCLPGRIMVALAPGNERLAERIRARYGPAVLITVGLTAWNGHPGRSPRCAALPTLSSLPKGLSVSLHLKSNRVRSGDTFTGQVTIRYGGPSSFDMDTGQPIAAVVVLPGTHRVVGVPSGAVAGTGYTVRLKAGQSHNVSVVGGTARCDGGIGSALPAGRYQAVAVIMDETGIPPRYVTTPVTIRPCVPRSASSRAGPW